MLHSRPKIHAAQCPAVSSQVSGDFAEFRPIWWELPRTPFYRRTVRAVVPRSADFSAFPENNRPLIRAVRNSALSAQVSGGFPGLRSGGGSLNIALLRRTGRAGEPRTSGIQDFLKISHNRPQFYDVRKSPYRPK